LTESLVRRFSRLGARARKRFWLARNGASRHTTPVYIVGAQRSGTRMLGECLGQSPEFESIGEANARAFVNFSIRDDRTIEHLIEDCPYRFIVFRALKDSHDVPRLLSRNPAAKAIWAYRHYLDRINSAVRMFGRHPLNQFAAFARGDPGVWQMRGISTPVEAVVRQFDFGDLSECDGAALMWWVRNSLYFSLGLETDPRVRPWSYDAFVRSPELELEELLKFLGGRFEAYMLSGVNACSLEKEAAPTLRADVRALCERLYAQLEDARRDGKGAASTHAAS
jgi:hypothetical protein